MGTLLLSSWSNWRCPLMSYNVLKGMLLVVPMLLPAMAFFASLPLLNSPSPISLLDLIKDKVDSQELVIVAESNTHFHPFARWWIGNMKKLQPPIDKYFIVALNKREYKALHKETPQVAYTEGTELQWLMHTMRFRSRPYNTVVMHKWKIVVDVLHSGHDLLLTDLDVWWRRNPLQYLKQLPQCDFYAATDVAPLPVKDGVVQIWPPFPSHNVANFLNTGLMFLRNTPRTLALANQVLRAADPDEDDQTVFNKQLDALRVAAEPHVRVTHDSTSCASYGNLTFYVLPPDLFQNTDHWKRYPQFNDSFTIHFNCMETINEKVAYLKKYGVW